MARLDLHIHLGSVEDITIITTTAKASGVRKSKALLLEEAGSKRSESRGWPGCTVDPMSLFELQRSGMLMKLLARLMLGVLCTT